nr:hypothetical protein [Tanacetum cinerariifolium]
MQIPEDISDPTNEIDIALVLMANAFILNDNTPTNNKQRSSSNPNNMQMALPVQNIRNQVVLNVVQNLGVKNVGNQNRLSVDPRIANQYGIRNVVTTRAEGNGNGINGNQIRCYNYQGVDDYARNCIVKPRKRDAAYLQAQLQISQKEEAKIQLNSEEFDFMAAIGAYDEIEEVSKQKDTTNSTSTNIKFTNQSTGRKPSFQSLRKNFVVRQPNAFQSERLKFSKTRVPPKVVESNDLSNPVTLNLAPSTRESTVVNNERLIALEVFRISPFIAYRVDNFVPNKHVKASVRTKPITVSQPHVITKKDVNSNINGFSPKNVESTTRIRRPQCRNSPKNDKAPSRDSYVVPASSSSTTTTDTTSGETGTKSRRTVTLTAEDMQKKKNDVKARITLLLSLPDDHQQQFSKYKTARELWAVILKTFGGNEATKKTKKNLLKQQNGNFKAEGSETLEQTFNRLENEDGNTACVPTASTNVPTASASVTTISQDTACAYIAS